MKIGAIDNGYWSTKILLDGKLGNIRSKYTEDPDGEFEYNSKKYVVGHGSENIDHNKTVNELHRIITYYALGMGVNFAEEFKLVLSLPLLHYRALRDDFKAYIMGEDAIKVKIKGKEKRIFIKDVNVFLQGVATVYVNNPNQYRKGLLAILDIGGLTAQGAILENLKPIPESIFTIDAGVIILNNKIKTRLNEKYCLNIQDYEVPYLIDFHEDIQKVRDEHFEQIALEMQKKNWSLSTLPILATGGGSLQFEVTRYLPKSRLSNDPIFDNVKGLGVVGEMIYR